MGERSEVGPQAPSSSTDAKDTKPRMRSEVRLEALWVGSAPHLRVPRKGVQRRGLCTETGCRAQNALQRTTRLPGEGKSDIPGRSPGHLGV